MFIRILFKLMYSLIKVPSEIYLLKRFGWQDMFAKLREKNYIIHINTIYKWKTNKIKLINLKKMIKKVPDKLFN